MITNISKIYGSGGQRSIVPSLFALILFALTLMPGFVNQARAEAPDSAKRILSLVDYIGGDYRNAVSDGQVINAAEYDEMIEFSSQVSSIFETLKSEDGDKANIASELKKLSTLIENKSSVDQVESVSATIKKRLIESYGIVPHPGKRPSIASGKELYIENCSQCHGVNGAGDGQLSHGIEPKPSNFTDPEFADGLSPFKVYNTTSFGIEGTAMLAFPALTSDEKWDISYYVLTLGTQGEIEGNISENDLSKDLTDYKTLATLTNSDIKGMLAAEGDSKSQISQVLAFIRRGTGVGGNDEIESIARTSEMLGESITLYTEGKKEEAYNKALDAYLSGYEKAESQIAVKNQSLNSSIENKFAELRSAMQSGASVSEVESLAAEIDTYLKAAAELYEETKNVSSTIMFTNSFAIIVREGLEAILIIAAIIAFLGATGSRSSIKYIHMGWIAALVAGLVTWLLARYVITISGAQREIIEGITALVAAAVLFYVSYWLITKIEVQKWKSYIKDKVDKAVSKKSVLALAGVSFFAVYREAFETVLFYQALWYQAENTQSALLWGFVAGVAVLVVIYFIVFKLALTIPIKYFFSVTSIFLYLLSFILLGKGIRELQEAGVVGITPFSILPTIDALGIYPTMQTAVPQLIVVLAFIFAIFWITYSPSGKKQAD